MVSNGCALLVEQMQMQSSALMQHESGFGGTATLVTFSKLPPSTHYFANGELSGSFLQINT